MTTENIPQEMKATKQWILWKFKEVPNPKTGGTKMTKVPLSPLTFQPHDVKDKSVYQTFEKIVEIHTKNSDFGIGFAFNTEISDICGIDIDNNNIKDTVTIKAKKQRNADDIILIMKSYTEKSPSGKGYHIYFHATKSNKNCRNTLLDLETYSRDRFFTVTGNKVSNETTVEKRQEEYDQVLEKYFKTDKPDIVAMKRTPIILQDQHVLNLLACEKDAHVFKALYTNPGFGDYPSQSEADGALSMKIAFYTQDVSQIKRIMFSSAKVRDKWNREAWMLGTINSAINKLSEYYTPPSNEDLSFDFPEDHKLSWVEAEDEAAKIFDKNGRVKKKQKKLVTDEYRKIFDKLGYSFALNELNDNIEVNGETYGDVMIGVVGSNLDDVGVFEKGQISHKITAFANENRYHPIKRYLDTLVWNGEKSIDHLIDCFEDEDGTFAIYFKKWIVGSIAKIYKRHQNKVLILNGKQNIGKSRFVDWLGSACEDGRYFISAELNAGDKDSLVRMASKWIWEIGELSGVSGKTSAGRIKSLITTVDLTVRKSYAKNDMTKPALTSFIGTVNDAGGFLNDKTGSRRFAVSTIKSIDWHRYLNELDPDDVWAEAYHLFNSGFDYEFNVQEEEMLEKQNEAYTVDDPVSDAIMEFIDFSDPNGEISSLELRKVVLEVTKVRCSDTELSQQIGYIMKKKKVKKITKRNRGTIYIGARYVADAIRTGGLL